MHHPGLIILRLFALVAIALTSACAKPTPSLPGQLTEIEFAVPDGEVRVIDWRVISRFATEDGYTYTRRPIHSQKPTREEILAKRALDETNALYTAYVESQAVQLRGQPEAIETVKEALLRAARRPFEYPQADPNPVRINATGGRSLKLILEPKEFVLPRRAVSTPKLLGDYQLLDANDGSLIDRGAFHARISPAVREKLDWLPSIDILARILLVALSREVAGL
jgi:hypothetical protein